ncbi:MAG: hypothetical protein ACYC27_21645 [Armatimonadota bacterium]
MKIIREEMLISLGGITDSNEWESIKEKLHSAIKSIDWPSGSGSFTIYPESGKKPGQGNGVVPIKQGLMKKLKADGWKLEEPMNLATAKKPGNVDAVLHTDYGPLALEWETGNISSSHRSLNKMALGLIKGILAGGILIVPTRNMYKYLTDRVGNIDELEPYLEFWRSIPCKEGILEIIVIEHDATSINVPRIPKCTDGRALR